MLLLQITGTETEILAQMLNTEAGRLIGLALVLMCGTMLYTVISSSRFNARLLTMTGSTASALDRNTAELKAQDSRIDGYLERDFAHREQMIAATSAHVEVMREYAAAFLEMRSALNTGVSAALGKHEETHGSLHQLKGAVESMQSAVVDLDHKITQELKQPLAQIVERLEALTAEIKQSNTNSSTLVKSVTEALSLMQSAKQILQLAASRQRSTDEYKKVVQSETNVASTDRGNPAAEPGQPGAGGGSSTGRESIGLDDDTPVTNRRPDYPVRGRHDPGDRVQEAAAGGFEPRQRTEAQPGES